jgi:RNA polymerase sigma-70 factor (ECF subfamily)
VKRQAVELLRLIAELPPPQREAFLLQQEGGMSVEAIAEATGVSRETAKSRLRYALARLREGMSKWH